MIDSPKLYNEIIMQIIMLYQNIKTNLREAVEI